MLWTGDECYVDKKWIVKKMKHSLKRRTVVICLKFRSLDLNSALVKAKLCVVLHQSEHWVCVTSSANQPSW